MPAGRGRSWSPATSTPATRWPLCSTARARRTSSPTTSSRASGSSSRPPPRRAIRAMFLSHVIGGKHLSQRADFTTMVQRRDPGRGADRGRAARRGGPGPSTAPATSSWSTSGAPRPTSTPSSTPVESEDVVALTAATRTVEGDLGMRWSATSTLDAAVEAGFLDGHRGATGRRRAAARRPRLPAGRAGRRPASTWPSQPRRSAWPCAGTPAAPRCGTTRPAAASWSAAAPTCARWISWSARVACCATPATRPVTWSTTSPPRAVGRCPSTRGSLSTPTTSSPPPGLLAERHPEAAYRLLQRLRADGARPA